MCPWWEGCLSATLGNMKTLKRFIRGLLATLPADVHKAHVTIAKLTFLALAAMESAHLINIVYRLHFGGTA